MPSGIFMFGMLGMTGQWILSKSNRYRQNKILESSPLLNDSMQSTKAETEEVKENLGTGLLKVLPVHRADVDDYEKKLLHKLELIEKEQKFLEAEVQRRKLLSSKDSNPQV